MAISVAQIARITLAFPASANWFLANPITTFAKTAVSPWWSSAVIKTQERIAKLDNSAVLAGAFRSRQLAVRTACGARWDMRVALMGYIVCEGQDEGSKR